ncbi:DegV family protein [Alkalibaculum bacchi]|uniref:DegV family protein n=1 Tax=Alkalibaculum bacchi TaxID=645887 RepID=UPI0026F0A749|nr:DegV family protein [Alkalibaculum bacchi]
MAIQIVTDSASDISVDEEKKYNIKVVPLTVHFGLESYRDRQEISPSQFYEKLESFDGIPRTSQVTPAEFIDVFKSIVNSGDEIIGIFMSSSMSGTYNSAMMAKNILDSDKISIIDSKMVTLGEALMVHYAAKMATEGKSRKEIVNKIHDMIPKNETLMIVDTLEYLKKGGRLSSSQAFLGSMLNIKPILTFSNGELVAKDKVRGKKKALNWVRNYLSKNEVSLKDKPVYMLHTGATEYLEDLKKILVEEYDANHIVESIVGAVVGTHAGPGAIAMSYVDE